MGRLTPVIAWTVDGETSEPIDARLLPLLAAIAATASLAAAVAECRVSYRAAWGLLREYEHRLGVALVALERGRGARLTDAGRSVLQAQQAAARRLARILSQLAVDVGAQAVRAGETHPLRLRIAASHDLALLELARTLPEAAGLHLDLSVMGSLHALREYAEGRADLGGFHVPIDRRATRDAAPFLQHLRARRDKLIRVVDREQGLILPQGNPARVRTFRDIGTRGLRFVNRQRGSGTRLLVDRLMGEERVGPSALDGYGNEEFTHAAVAATVASGGADVGFGLRAAAAEYGLAFVPLARERYYLAVRATDLAKAAEGRLVAALCAPAFARAAKRLPGYHAAAAGSITGVEALQRAAGS